MVNDSTGNQPDLSIDTQDTDLSEGPQQDVGYEVSTADEGLAGIDSRAIERAQRREAVGAFSEIEQGQKGATEPDAREEWQRELVEPEVSEFEDAQLDLLNLKAIAEPTISQKNDQELETKRGGGSGSGSGSAGTDLVLDSDLAIESADTVHDNSRANSLKVIDDLNVREELIAIDVASEYISNDEFSSEVHSGVLGWGGWVKGGIVSAYEYATQPELVAAVKNRLTATCEIVWENTKKEFQYVENFIGGSWDAAGEVVKEHFQVVSGQASALNARAQKRIAEVLNEAKSNPLGAGYLVAKYLVEESIDRSMLLLQTGLSAVKLGGRAVGALYQVNQNIAKAVWKPVHEILKDHGVIEVLGGVLEVVKAPFEIAFATGYATGQVAKALVNFLIHDQNFDKFMRTVQAGGAPLRKAIVDTFNNAGKIAKGLGTFALEFFGANDFARMAVSLTKGNYGAATMHFGMGCLGVLSFWTLGGAGLVRAGVKQAGKTLLKRSAASTEIVEALVKEQAVDEVLKQTVSETLEVTIEKSAREALAESSQTVTKESLETVVSSQRDQLLADVGVESVETASREQLKTLLAKTTEVNGADVARKSIKELDYYFRGPVGWVRKNVDTFSSYEAQKGLSRRVFTRNAQREARDLVVEPVEQATTNFFKKLDEINYLSRTELRDWAKEKGFDQIIIKNGENIEDVLINLGKYPHKARHEGYLAKKLEEELTETLTTPVLKGFKNGAAKEIDEGVETLAKRHGLDKTAIKEGAEEGIENGVRKGVRQGVRQGIKQGIRRFRKGDFVGVNSAAREEKREEESHQTGEYIIDHEWIEHEEKKRKADDIEQLHEYRRRMSKKESLSETIKKMSPGEKAKAAQESSDKAKVTSSAVSASTGLADLAAPESQGKARSNELAKKLRRPRTSWNDREVDENEKEIA